MNEATIAKKVQKVDEVNAKISAAGSTLFVDYLGLTVAEVTELRTKLHAENCEMKVVKNNILSRATKEMGLDLDAHFVGPSAMVNCPDEVAAAKVCYDFAKEHEHFQVKAGIVSGVVTAEKDLAALAKLPNKPGMISMLLSVLQAPIRGLACAIKAVSEKEE